MHLPTVLLIFLLSINCFAKEQSFQPNPLLSKLGVYHDPKKISQEELMGVMEKRQTYLKRHKILGQTTIALMTATALLGIYGGHQIKKRRAGKGNRTNDADKMHPHIMASGLTAATYLTTAYHSIFAPKFTDSSDPSEVIWHKRLAYFHFPAMILGPILGLIAHKQVKDGETVHGLAKAHRPIMYLGYAATFAAFWKMTF